jgi:hypothetical protein
MTKYVAHLSVIALILGGSILMMSCSDDKTPKNATDTSPVTATKSPAVDTLPPAKPNYGGAFDVVKCDQLGGWVWDSANPNEDIKVDIYVDGKLVTTVPAKNQRPDLKTSGTGNYGFALHIPPEFKDGKPHTVGAKVAGSNYDIKLWEKIQPTFTCKPNEGN